MVCNLSFGYMVLIFGIFINVLMICLLNVVMFFCNSFCVLIIILMVMFLYVLNLIMIVFCILGVSLLKVMFIGLDLVLIGIKEVDFLF